jgi:hypothetical protein
MGLLVSGTPRQLYTRRCGSHAGAPQRNIYKLGAAGKALADQGIMLQSTFTQKLLLTIACGFAAACLFWTFRHIVERAFYESNEGWKDTFRSTPAKRVR